MKLCRFVTKEKAPFNSQLWNELGSKQLRQEEYLRPSPWHLIPTNTNLTLSRQSSFQIGLNYLRKPEDFKAKPGKSNPWSAKMKLWKFCHNRKGTLQLATLQRADIEATAAGCSTFSMAAFPCDENAIIFKSSFEIGWRSPLRKP